MRGNKGRQEERHYSNDLRGFCLHGCDVTHQQSMFRSERSTLMRCFEKKTLTSFVAHDRVRLARGSTVVAHTCTNTRMLVSVLAFLLQ